MERKQRRRPSPSIVVGRCLSALGEDLGWVASSHHLRDLRLLAPTLARDPDLAVCIGRAILKVHRLMRADSGQPCEFNLHILDDEESSSSNSNPVAPEPKPENCSTCRFFDCSEGQYAPGQYAEGRGACLRYPPRYEPPPKHSSVDCDKHFPPVVYAEGWCGEWKGVNS